MNESRVIKEDYNDENRLRSPQQRRKPELAAIIDHLDDLSINSHVLVENLVVVDGRGPLSSRKTGGHHPVHARFAASLKKHVTTCPTSQSDQMSKYSSDANSSFSEKKGSNFIRNLSKKFKSAKPRRHTTSLCEFNKFVKPESATTDSQTPTEQAAKILNDCHHHGYEQMAVKAEIDDIRSTNSTANGQASVKKKNR